ncbi:MAG: hypothetical protein MIO92_12545 [Methanosarcinaceae archaeon]|nr:hypothetical protein [Methanosarcinaceae archaeon]
MKIKSQQKVSDTQRQEQSGPQKGDFIEPPVIIEVDELADALPQQEEFWRPPTRFGSVPVEKEPLGWDRRRGFRRLFPTVYLPFQVIERVPFGHPALEPNRLFWGDNLHIMRQLPSESIDLIYIDPPFFSGRQYNVLFGDQNELRSFSDIWEGGMPGYLVWLNARLYEMKRLLKKTGGIYVHCDWHASHYIKAELDKIFGNDNFRNEIIWSYTGRLMFSPQRFNSKHDVILFYSKTNSHRIAEVTEPISREYYLKMKKQELHTDPDGREWIWGHAGKGKSHNYKIYIDEVVGKGRNLNTVWSIPIINTSSKERIGYPTQKPEALLERIIQASSKEGDVVADFFLGGGTTAAVAQRLGRRWVACDQSRVAVAITADRLARQVEEQTGNLFSVPDFTLEHWGVYETRRLSDMPPDQFRGFILKCFGAVGEEHQPGIYGMKGAIPVWVGEANPRKGTTGQDVQDFANGIRKTLRYRQDNLREGIMLAWAFRQDAIDAADRLRRLEQTDINFIRLEQVRIDSPRFREHVAALSTNNADYANFLTFVQPPKVEVGYKRISGRIYVFDVTESVVMNAGAKIINVQWDFDYGKRFSSTPGYSFVHGSKQGPVLQVQYEFPESGRIRIACKVQDDMGGEGLGTLEVEIA